MTIDKVIEILDSGKAPETEQDFEDFDTAMETAISLLRTHPDAQPNEPLTLEELRGMDGQPGWCKEYKHWGLISVCSSGRRAHIPYFQFCKNGIIWANNTQKLNLTIYRRPPKEEHHEEIP